MKQLLCIASLLLGLLVFSTTYATSDDMNIPVVDHPTHGFQKQKGGELSHDLRPHHKPKHHRHHKHHERRDSRIAR